MSNVVRKVAALLSLTSLLPEKMEWGYAGLYLKVEPDADMQGFNYIYPE